MKYVVVTGGVISGLGKGISISSLAALFKAATMVLYSPKAIVSLRKLVIATRMEAFEHRLDVTTSKMYDF